MGYWKWKAFDLAPARLLDHSTGFRRQLIDLDATPDNALRRFHRTLDRHWKTLSDEEKRNIFLFAESCARQLLPDTGDAAVANFYASLFDNRDRDWSEIVMWLSPFVVEKSWPSWEARLSEDDMARLRDALATRTEVRYEPLAIATQTTEATIPRQPPLADVMVRLTMQLEIPSPYGGGPIGTQYPLTTMWEDWDIELDEYLHEGVLAGITSVDWPRPDGGMDFAIASLVIEPAITNATTAEDVRQIGEALYGMTAGLAVSLWQGLLAFSMVPRDASYVTFSENYWYRAIRKGNNVRGMPTPDDAGDILQSEEE